MKDRATPDDPAICGLCGHETSIAMIARHLEVEHDTDPSDIANAPIVDAAGDAHIHGWRVDYSQPIIDTLPQQAWYVCECGAGQLMDYPPQSAEEARA
jgi:hypothetical protein